MLKVPSSNTPSFEDVSQEKIITAYREKDLLLLQLYQKALTDRIASEKGKVDSLKLSEDLLTKCDLYLLLLKLPARDEEKNDLLI